MIIYVYNGAGSVTESANNLRDALSGFLFKFGYDVKFIGSKDIIDGKLTPHQADLFVLGGGRFTQVKQALGEEGLRKIQNYTYAGGRYVGICMGSYAAFSQIDFRGKEAATSNGLAFLSATSRGSLHSIATAYDGTAESAAILELSHLRNGEKFPALYWGGNGMDEEELIDIGAEPLAKLRVLDNQGLVLEDTVMSARIDVGDNGGKAFICGYHPEGYSHQKIWEWLRLRKPTLDNYQRLENELFQHPNNAYLMGLACLLDDIELLPDYSFVKQIYQEEQKASRLLRISAPDEPELVARKFSFTR